MARLEEHGPTAHERELGREAIARIKAGPLASSAPPQPRQFAGIPPAPTVAPATVIAAHLDGEANTLIRYRRQEQTA